MSKTAIMEKPKQDTQLANASGLVITSSDIDIPRLNLVQKTSAIDGEVGSLVLDKQYILAGPEEKIDAVVMSATKMWREDIPFDEGKQGRIAYTEEEARAMGADSEYEMIEFADICLVFKQPEGGDDSEAYPFPIGDHQYAFGRLNVAKDAFRQTYKRITTFAAFNPSLSLQARVWKFHSGMLTRGRNSWYAPSLAVVAKGEPDQALIEFVAQFK